MTCNNLPPDNDIVGLDAAINDNFATNVPMPLQIADSLSSRAIKLVWHASKYKINELDGVRVRIEAVSSFDMPTKVFAYLAQPLEAGESARSAAFNHVCSASDLEEFPEDAPLSGLQPAWFRLNYIDIVLRARAEAHIFIREVAEDVYHLKQTLDATDRIFPAGEITFGVLPVNSSSSSSSSASSNSSASSSSG
jgi:hypothetical protein